MEFPLLAPVTWGELTVRLGVALLVGASLGFERELKGKSAGLRTFMLVSLGSAFFVLIPIQLDTLRQNAEALSRVMQGIIAGIGFIGGGVILHQARDRSEAPIVRGLTSAATVWIVAALGTAAGCGLSQLALIGAGVSFFVLRVLKQLEER